MISPIDSRDLSDPGDMVLRKFRYQHAYGVVLSVGIATGKLDYTALWCEQHEDFLAETAFCLFDAYQIKTRKSELGEWQLNHEAFWQSIYRFVKLDLKYPDKIRSFRFVSNTDFSGSAAKRHTHLSPRKLLTGVKLVTRWEDLVDETKIGFNWLKDKLEVEESDLFTVLRRMEVVLGPTDRAFEEELSIRHIPTLDECKSMSASSLARVCDGLIAMIAKASSLVSDDPSRDWVGLTHKSGEDPFLRAKRITAKDVINTVLQFGGISSRLHTTPLGKVADQIVTSLQGLPGDNKRKNEIIGGIVCNHKVEIAQWLPDGDLCYPLAMAMLNLGLRKSIPILRDLSIHVGSKDLRSILDLLEPTWVDLSAADCISKRALHKNHKKAVALNACRLFSAKMYVRRASCLPPESWPIDIYSGIFGGNPVNDIVREIEGLLIPRILKSKYYENMSSEEKRKKLRERLKEMKKDKMPVFIALKYSKNISELLPSIQNALPYITLFLLTGENFPQLTELGEFDCKLLYPSLGLDAENQAYEEVNYANDCL